MEAADYRLVRSEISAGIMLPIKRHVVPSRPDHSFSYWLYGERKSIDALPANLMRSNPCHICQRDFPPEDFSLLNVDLRLVERSLPLFDLGQLITLYSLLNDDRQAFQSAIRQQYHSYRQSLLVQLRKYQRI